MKPGSHAISVTVVWEIGMAKKSEPKDWAEECADSVKLEAPESVRVTLKDQLKGGVPQVAAACTPVANWSDQF